MKANNLIKLKSVISILSVNYFFIFFIICSYMLCLNCLCFAQNTGQKLKAKINPSSKKFLVFEQTDVLSSFIGSIRNGDIVEILQKKDNWLKVKLSSGKTGWVKYNPSGKDWNSAKGENIPWDWEFVSPISTIKDIKESRISSNDQSISDTQSLLSLQRRLSDLENKVQQLETIVMKLSVNSSSGTISSEPQKPSNDIIKAAIKAHLKVNVPISWSGSLMGGKNSRVHSLEILQIGNYNNRIRYWPVKARVQGTCDAQYITRTKPHSFDKVGDFKIYQDDYGNWRASIDMMLLHPTLFKQHNLT